MMTNEVHPYISFKHVSMIICRECSLIFHTHKRHLCYLVQQSSNKVVCEACHHHTCKYMSCYTFLYYTVYVYIITLTYRGKKDIEENDGHQRANVEDSTKDKHQNIPTFVVILLSTSDPVKVSISKYLASLCMYTSMEYAHYTFEFPHVPTIHNACNYTHSFHYLHLCLL